MKILSVASAFPEKLYPQQRITGALKHLWQDQLDNPAVLDRLHANCGVQHRHLALNLEDYPHVTTFGQSNNHWIEAAQQLGSEAISKAARLATIDLSTIAAFFFVSVTGIASPSIDARLINRLSLPSNIKRIPIFGLGCVGGAAGIARAADYVRAFPSQIAILLSVELCSLNWQREDLSAANLIAAGLFGDGAAAVVVAGKDTDSEGIEILGTRSSFYPDTEDVMGWDISEKGFRLVLSPAVPDVIRKHLRQDVDVFLAEYGLVRQDISTWIIHTGGPKVLRAVEAALELPEDALEASWESLRQVGNLSSTSVLSGAGRISQKSPGKTRNLQSIGCNGARILLRVRSAALVTMTIKSDFTDVLILGGGPAGLSAAIALRQKGIDCLVVEALEPSIDKGCALSSNPCYFRRLLSVHVGAESLHRFALLQGPRLGFSLLRSGF